MEPFCDTTEIGNNHCYTNCGYYDVTYLKQVEYFGYTNEIYNIQNRFLCRNVSVSLMRVLDEVGLVYHKPGKTRNPL